MKKKILFATAKTYSSCKHGIGYQVMTKYLYFSICVFLLQNQSWPALYDSDISEP